MRTKTFDKSFAMPSAMAIRTSESKEHCALVSRLWIVPRDTPAAAASSIYCKFRLSRAALRGAARTVRISPEEANVKSNKLGIDPFYSN